MSKTAEEILEIRKRATYSLELTKGFTPEQRAGFSNALKTVEEFAGYILELTNGDSAQEVAKEIEAYKERLKVEIRGYQQSNSILIGDIVNIIDTVK